MNYQEALRVVAFSAACPGRILLVPFAVQKAAKSIATTDAARSYRDHATRLLLRCATRSFSERRVNATLIEHYSRGGLSARTIRVRDVKANALEAERLSVLSTEVRRRGKTHLYVMLTLSKMTPTTTTMMSIGGRETFAPNRKHSADSMLFFSEEQCF